MLFSIGPLILELAMVSVIFAVLFGWQYMAVVVAVSYTHLRAHETVLDLVCRLLLETKKTHN